MGEGLGPDGTLDGAGGNTAQLLHRVKDDIRARAKRLELKNAEVGFESCEFAAYVLDLKIKPGGDLEIRLGVPKAVKWEALELSEASGMMIRMTCTRIRRRPKHDDALAEDTRGRNGNDHQDDSA